MIWVNKLMNLTPLKTYYLTGSHTLQSAYSQIPDSKVWNVWKHTKVLFFLVARSSCLDFSLLLCFDNFWCWLLVFQLNTSTVHTITLNDVLLLTAKAMWCGISPLLIHDFQTFYILMLRCRPEENSLDNHGRHLSNARKTKVQFFVKLILIWKETDIIFG